jgi:hypothetical protein
MVINQPPLPLEALSEADWRVDERTRDVGRRGLADARAALAEARRRADRRDAELAQRRHAA